MVSPDNLPFAPWPEWAKCVDANPVRHQPTVDYSPKAGIILPLPPRVVTATVPLSEVVLYELLHFAFLKVAMSASERIPKAMAETCSTITALTDAFHGKYLNDEYVVLIRRVDCYQCERLERPVEQSGDIVQL